MNKEQRYDAEIAPLMKQIIAICKAHGIAMCADFHIPTPDDDALFCTTSIPDENGEQPPEIRRAVECMYRRGGPPPMRITTRDASGKVTHDEVVICD